MARVHHRQRVDMGELVLGDALCRITVASIFFAFDAALKVVVQLRRIGERVGRCLHDRRGERVSELGARLAAVYSQRAETKRLAPGVARGRAARAFARAVVRPTADLALSLAHYPSSSRTRST